MPNLPVFQIISVLSILAIIYFIYYRIILAGNDPLAFTKNFMYNILTIIIPVIIIFILISLLSFEQGFVMYLVFGGVAAVIVSLVVYYFLQTTLSQYIFNQYLLYAVIAAIILLGASIVITIFSGTLRKLTGWTGFFINLLFYIPCLIRDAIGGAVSEYNSFSNTLIILFSIEIILILMYFFLIPFIDSRIFPKKTVLLDEPIMLNTGMPLKTPVDISNNFALSMWVYVNPGNNINKPGSISESNIFSFLDAQGNNHIKLAYSNVEQGNNEFIIYVGEQSFPLTLPLQKWHNFVINYVTYDNEVPSSSPASTTTPIPTNNVMSWGDYIKSFFYKIPVATQPPPMVKQTTVDIFVNGNLEISSTYDGESPTILNNSTISIGNIENDISITAKGVKQANRNNLNREGLYGSICNVVFYDKPITKMALVYNYNLLIIRSPPV